MEMTTKQKVPKTIEQWGIIFFLIFVFLFVIGDLLSDPTEQLKGLHLFIEVGIGVLSFLGIIFFYILSNKTKSQLDHKSQELFAVQHQLEETQEALKISKEQRVQVEIEIKNWKEETKKYTEGLSDSIDKQFEKWSFTNAEKEIALLILKGLSLKEIASIRNVAEKTARAQATNVYNKSGLHGRSELSAFFLEDLLQKRF